MNYLRQFAENGVAVIVVSAVGRSKDSRGRNTYAGDGLNLASFRESSELEFGADSAWILSPKGGQDDPEVTLRHLKDRHGEVRDIPLHFDRARQSFTVPDDRKEVIQPGKVTSALCALWDSTEPATDDGRLG